MTRAARSHVDGWGLASFDNNGEPRITKSVRAAFNDVQFAELAKSVATTALLAHVRQASVGRTALVNTHPFVHGRWVFAQNGTLQGFAARKGALLDAIPDDLQQLIRGDTDSEHVFLFWLSQLRAAAGGLDKFLGVDTIIASFQQTINLLDGWFPPAQWRGIEVQFRRDGRAPACRHAMGTLVVVPGASGQRNYGWKRFPAPCNRHLSRCVRRIGGNRQR